MSNVPHNAHDVKYICPRTNDAVRPLEVRIEGDYIWFKCARCTHGPTDFDWHVILPPGMEPDVATRPAPRAPTAPQGALLAALTLVGLEREGGGAPALHAAEYAYIAALDACPVVDAAALERPRINPYAHATSAQIDALVAELL